MSPAADRAQPPAAAPRLAVGVGATLGAMLLPALFVTLWSTGFIAGKFGLSAAGPLTFLALRFIAGAATMAAIAWASAAPWPRRDQLAPLVVAGLLIQAVYLTLSYTAMALGVETGVAALMTGLLPLLTAALASLLGERTRPGQWLGLALGLAGVAATVAAKLAHGLGSPLGMGAAALSAVALSAGTLWQARRCGGADLRTGAVVQYVAAALALAPFAAAVEGFRFAWTAEFVAALVWGTLALSVGAILALFALIRRGGATRAASFFFLVPPTTALMGYFAFGETLSPAAAAGLALVVAGIMLVNRARN